MERFLPAAVEVHDTPLTRWNTAELSPGYRLARGWANHRARCSSLARVGFIGSALWGPPSPMPPSSTEGAQHHSARTSDPISKSECPVEETPSDWAGSCRHKGDRGLVLTHVIVPRIKPPFVLRVITSTTGDTQQHHAPVDMSATCAVSASQVAVSLLEPGLRNS